MTSRPTRHQLRRQARRLRRDGFQPMVVFSQGDQLPETAAVAIGRALWRYRSELAPIAFALLTVAAALMLHRSHPGAWPWLALGTVASTAIQAVPVPAWLRKAWSAIDRPAERVYASVVTVVTGGWLTAATTLGPATTSMLILAAGLTLICALPWWASHRRRAKVRVDRLLESWPEIATAIGLAGSQVMSARVDVWGWRAASAWLAARPSAT